VAAGGTGPAAGSRSGRPGVPAITNRRTNISQKKEQIGQATVLRPFRWKEALEEMINIYRPGCLVHLRVQYDLVFVSGTGIGILQSLLDICLEKVYTQGDSNGEMSGGFLRMD
jgi:hypothetical protein